MLHNLLAIAALLMFAATAAIASGRSEEGDRNRTNLFIIVALSITFTVGLAQRTSFYPFHQWTLFGGLAPDSLLTTEWRAVDSLGAEHEIDFRAWQPISWWELSLWFQLRFPEMAPEAQRASAEHLLDVAERARRRASNGGSVGSSLRILGPATIPLFHTYATTWDAPADVPALPFVGLRWYQEWLWLTPTRPRGTRSQRHIVYEFLGAAP